MPDGATSAASAPGGRSPLLASREPAFNLADLFEAIVDRVPEREAVVCGVRRLTYAELDERANRLACWLAGQGAGPGDRVGLQLYNRAEYLEGMLAAFKLRAVPVNVNYRYVADELRYLYGDAGLAVVVHEEDLSEVVETAAATSPTVRATLATGEPYERVLAAAEPRRPQVVRSGDDRYVLYTGGTTGMPKGVVWRHEDIFHAAIGALGGVRRALSPGAVVEQAASGRTRCLPTSPFIHGTAHWVALATLYGGGTVVVLPSPNLDPEAVWDAVDAEGVTFLAIVGDAFGRPLVDALDASPGRWDLGSLSVVLSGGAVLSPAVKDALSSRLAGVLVVDGYGTSETGGQGTMIGEVKVPGPSRFRVNDETAVLDDDLRPVPPGSGVVGRVARRGHIPLGYLGDPERTATTFPVVDGVRWAVPGDLALVEAEGTIVLLGRGSVSINTGGEKVFPDEVEAVLKEHPDVFDAVVVGVPDPRWGERVTAVVQPRAGRRPPSLEALADHARDSLAPFKVPRALVVVDAVVRSAAGKPDYAWARSEAERRLHRQA